MAVNRQVGEELVDFGRPHLPRVPFVMEENETADPLDVALFGAQAVVAYLKGSPHAVEQTWRLTGLRHRTRR